jgi:hypothetical protein
VVIDDLDFPGVPVAPDEADSPLIIDTNAVLTLPASMEWLEAVSRGNGQVRKRPRRMQQQQLPARDAFERSVTRNVTVVKEVSGRA